MSDPISTDLAIVGRVSRERPIALESTLRAIGAMPYAVAPRTSDASLVVMSRIYAQRVARIASGVAVIAYVLAQLVVALVPTTEEAMETEGSVLDVILWEPSLVQVLGVLALVYMLALHRGARTYRRAIAVVPDAHARASELVRHIDGWSIAIAIAATTTFTIVRLAMHLLYLGDLLWLKPVGTPAWTEADALTYAVPLVVPIAAALVGAFVVARRYREWAAPAWGIPVAIPALAMALAFASSGREDPYLAHYIAFVGAMGLVFIVVAWWALSRRRRELAAMEAS